MLMMLCMDAYAHYNTFSFVHGRSVTIGWSLPALLLIIVETKKCENHAHYPGLEIKGSMVIIMG